MDNIREILFNRYADGDTKGVVKNLVYIAEKYSDEDKEFAETIEKDLLSVAMEIAVLFGSGKFKKNDLEKTRLSFRKMCGSALNAYRIDSFKEQIERIVKNFQAFQIDIVALLAPHSKKHSEKIEKIGLLICRKEFLLFAFEKEKEALKHIIYTFSYYLEITND